MVFALVLFVVVVAVALAGFGRPSDTTLAAFSDTYSVPVDEESRPLLEKYIRGSRSLRMVGVALGLATGSAVLALTDQSVNMTGYGAIGYGLGAVTYESFRRAPGPGGATLARRRLDDYVAPMINRLLYAVTAFGIASWALSFMYAPDPAAASRFELNGYRVAGAVSIGCLVLAALAGRRIIRSPQPVISRSIDAAQHAVRTAGLISLVGLSLMASGVLAFGGVEVVQGDPPLAVTIGLGWLGVPLAVLASMLGFFLTIRSLPRFAPFWRRLPPIEGQAASA